MNNLDYPSEFIYDTNEIEYLSYVWNNRPKLDERGQSKDSIYFDSFEANILMLKGVEIAIDFYLTYQDFIICKIDNKGLNEEFTILIIEKYLNSIINSMSTNLEYQYYPYPFGKNISVFERDRWYLMRNTTFNDEINTEIADFRRKKWEILFETLDKCDYLTIELLKTYNDLFDFTKWILKYKEIRTGLEQKYYSSKLLYISNNNIDPFKLLPFNSLLKKQLNLRESDNKSHSNFNKICSKIRHYFKR